MNAVIPLRTGAVRWTWPRADSVLLAFAVLAHLTHLPVRAWGLAAAAALAALAAVRSGARIASPAVRRLALTGLLALAGAACALAVWLLAGRRIDGTGLLAFGCCALILRRAETRHGALRDRLSNVYAAFALCAFLPAYYDTEIGVPLAALAAFLLLWALCEAHGDARRSGARTALRLLGLGLPAASLLFLLFPRVPGPLLDIGMAIGLPLRVEAQRSRAGMGLDGSFTARVRPSAGRRSDPTVLVAEFRNHVPALSGLYWRGPVLWRYDGETWRQQLDGDNRSVLFAQGPRSAQRLAASLSFTGQKVDYSVRLMPNGQRWMYALDLPASTVPESFISRDDQLLAVRVAREPTRFDMSAWLDWRGGALTLEMRELSLQLPPDSDPRTQALGRRLAEEAGSPDAAAEAVLQHFARGGYHVAPANELLPGRNAYDRILFDLKEAHPDQMAGAFVLLMRAAGVPARLVTGYRGGRSMALTNYVVVKQSHAHAWPEVFLQGRGWTRYEPSDLGRAIAPKGQPAQVAAAPTPAAAPSAAAVGTDLGDLPEHGRSLPANAAPALPWIDGLLDALARPLRWVARFDPAQQTVLLRLLGLGGQGWLALLALVALAIGLLAVAAWALTKYIGRPRLDALGRAWKDLDVRLRAIGIAREPAECVSRFALRAAALRPDLAESLDSAARIYLEGRYGASDTAAARLRQIVRILPI